MTRLRTLVVDDSVAFRTALVRALKDADSIEVIGEAGSGDEAIYMAERLKPDVISMDVIMPRCSGIEAAQKILEKRHIPIVLLSTMSRTDEQWMALNALRLGVLEVANKPTLVGPAAEPELRALIAVLHNAAAAGTTKANGASTPISDRMSIARPKSASLIVVGSSTGGPAALEHALGGMEAQAPPVVIAQHLAPNLSASLAKWLSGSLRRPFHLVDKPMPLTVGCAYLAATGVNIEVTSGGIVHSTPTTAAQNVAPNVNLLFTSVAQRYGARAAGVILTGMGSDGAAGLKALRAAGGWTAAQDQRSSVVYGMPLAAYQGGGCQEILSLDGIRQALATIQFDPRHPGDS